MKQLFYLNIQKLIEIKKNIIKLPNIGRCDHTYLYHIVNNYNNLSNIIVFFTGSLNVKIKKKKAISILNNIINSNYTEAYFKCKYYTSVKTHFENFKLEYYRCRCKTNFIKNNKEILSKCKIRPYGNWYSYFFKNIEINYVCLLGIFSINKKDIIKHPATRYTIFMNIVSEHSNPEAGHYIERSWEAIFYPLVYTKIILEK